MCERNRVRQRQAKIKRYCNEHNLQTGQRAMPGARKRVRSALVTAPKAAASLWTGSVELYQKKEGTRRARERNTALQKYKAPVQKKWDSDRSEVSWDWEYRREKTRKKIKTGHPPSRAAARPRRGISESKSVLLFKEKNLTHRCSAIMIE